QGHQHWTAAVTRPAGGGHEDTARGPFGCPGDSTGARMTRYVFAAGAVLWIASSVASFTQSRPEPAAPASPRAAAPSPARSSPAPATDVSAHTKVVGQYCLGCHNQKAKAGGLALEGVDLSSPGANADVWEKVVLKLRGGLMPPGGMPRPSEPARL